MKVREGRYYRTRDGRRVGPAKPYKYRDSAPEFPWSLGETWVYTEDGVAGDGTHRDYDLVAEWTDESTGPVITETVKRIVPGDYGRLRVGETDHDRGWIDLYLPTIGHTAAECREIAAHLNAIADALEPVSP